jgi:hypothetical protein
MEMSFMVACLYNSSATVQVHLLDKASKSDIRYSQRRVEANLGLFLTLLISVQIRIWMRLRCIMNKKEKESYELQEKIENDKKLLKREGKLKKKFEEKAKA